MYVHIAVFRSGISAISNCNSKILNISRSVSINVFLVMCYSGSKS